MEFNTTLLLTPELATKTVYIDQTGVFEALFFSLTVFALSVIVHELAHWLYLRKFNPNAKITVVAVRKGIQLRTGEESDYVNLSRDEKATLYFYGIVAGIFPIVIAGMIHPVYLLTLPGYVVGCYSDFAKLFDLMRIQ